MSQTDDRHPEVRQVPARNAGRARFARNLLRAAASFIYHSNQPFIGALSRKHLTAD
jgi:hypothetical protein